MNTSNSPRAGTPDSHDHPAGMLRAELGPSGGLDTSGFPQQSHDGKPMRQISVQNPDGVEVAAGLTLDSEASADSALRRLGFVRTGPWANSAAAVRRRTTWERYRIGIIALVVIALLVASVSVASVKWSQERDAKIEASISANTFTYITVPGTLEIKSTGGYKLFRSTNDPKTNKPTKCIPGNKFFGYDQPVFLTSPDGSMYQTVIENSESDGETFCKMLFSFPSVKKQPGIYSLQIGGKKIPLKSEDVAVGINVESGS